jgi:hypothetical protein
VKREVVNNWIQVRLCQILGFEDEVVIGLVVHWLDEPVRVVSSVACRRAIA